MRRHLPIVVLLACAAAIAFGMIELFELRFNAGDVYPPYSTLRTDPLGAMAIYEALQQVPGVSAHRDLSTSNRLPDQPGTDYLQLGASTEDWDLVFGDLFRELSGFISGGGRLVITFFPETWYARPSHQHPDSMHKSDKRNKPDSDEPASDADKDDKQMTRSSREESFVMIRERWGFHFDYQALPVTNGHHEPVMVVNRSDLPLPEFLDWHSGLIFTNLDLHWRVIYARGSDPVAIERNFGKGSVVMATDSYFLSNEAMAKDRHADLIAWLVGPGRNIVFDEAHFGIAERPGVTSLLRQYRLHGLIVGLALLAALFIWKNAASLAPPVPDTPATTHIAGKDTASGLVNLIRRSVPERDLLETCFAEWKKTKTPAAGASQARLHDAERELELYRSLPPKQRDAARTYRQICAVLGTAVHPKPPPPNPQHEH